MLGRIAAESNESSGGNSLSLWTGKALQASGLIETPILRRGNM